MFEHLDIFSETSIQPLKTPVDTHFMQFCSMSEIA